MKDLILKGIRHSITLFAKWLSERDEDRVGFDDAAARILECISMIIQEVEKGNTMSRKTVVIALEAAQILAENIDQNDTGIDDAIARRINDLKVAIDLGVSKNIA